MKNKLIICLALMIVCIPFIWNITASAYAEKTNKEQFIYSTLSDFLEIQDIDFDSDILVSEPFDVFDFDNEVQIFNKEIYFVSSKNELIGLLAVDYVNNEFQANFSEVSDGLLSELYHNNVSFIYGLHNDIAVVWYENEFHSLDNDIVYDLNFNDDLYIPKSIDSIGLNASYPLYAVQSNVILRSSAIYNKQLSNISIVKNGTDPSGRGICWAATMAMKINRESSSWGNMDAEDVYWNMRIKCGGDPIGTIYSDHAIYTIYDCNKTQKCYQYVSDKAMSDYKYFVYNASSSRTYDNWFVTVY